MANGKGDVTMPLPAPEGRGKTIDPRTMTAPHEQGTDGASRAVAIPQVFASRYEVQERLGEGGMGLVLKAYDRKLDRVVALKVLPAHIAENPLAIKRFRREAETLAALQHPHIVPIHDVDEDPTTGLHFITMDLLEGEPLDVVVKRLEMDSSALSLRECIAIVVQVAEALTAAHEKGILHRDLKPANIFVGHGGHVWVVDWGLGKREKSASATSAIPQDPNLTAPDAVFGTPFYMSPEQALSKELDSRSDLWSLGVVLYELATEGVRPITGDSTHAIIMRILHPDPVPSLSVVRPGISRRLSAIVALLLCKDRKHRPQSAREIASALVVYEAFDAIRAWRTAVRATERCLKQLIALEPAQKTGAVLDEEYALAERLSILREEEKERALERAAAAVERALQGRALTPSDRRRLALHFSYRAYCRAFEERSPGFTTRFRESFTTALGEKEPMVALVMERRRCVRLIVDPPYADVFVAPLVLEGHRSVPGTPTLVVEGAGTSVRTVTLPLWEERCITVAAPGYASETIGVCLGRGPRCTEFSIALVKEEVLGKGWKVVPKLWYPIGTLGKGHAPRWPRWVKLPKFAVAENWVTIPEYAAFLQTLLSDEVRRKHWPLSWPWEEKPLWNAPFYRQDDMPAVGVSWEDGTAYAEWRSDHEGIVLRLGHSRESIRLLTEEEWEAAVRGPFGWDFPWGNGKLDRKRVPTGAMGLAHAPKIGAFTPDGDPPGDDISFFGVRQPTALSTPCLIIRGDSVPEKEEKEGVKPRRRGIIRSGSAWFSDVPYHYSVSRAMVHEDEKWPGSGIRLMRVLVDPRVTRG